MLLYKLSQEEVLEIIAVFANQKLPREKRGTFDIEYNDDGEIEVHFFSKNKKELN